MDAEVTSDLCLSCRVTIEDECFTFNHHHRWHPKCLICSGCAKSQTSVYYDASYDATRGSVLCQQCKTPESKTGFSHVTKLEQYTFLLRVALIRLENLLHLKGTVEILSPECKWQRTKKKKREITGRELSKNIDIYFSFSFSSLPKKKKKQETNKEIRNTGFVIWRLHPRADPCRHRG